MSATALNKRQEQEIQEVLDELTIFIPTSWSAARTALRVLKKQTKEVLDALLIIFAIDCVGKSQHQPLREVQLSKLQNITLEPSVIVCSNVHGILHCLDAIFVDDSLTEEIFGGIIKHQIHRRKNGMLAG
jgi:hypothetical protein